LYLYLQMSPGFRAFIGRLCGWAPTVTGLGCLSDVFLFSFCSDVLGRDNLSATAVNDTHLYTLCFVLCYVPLLKYINVTE